jgi:hypothetical protein
MTEASPIAFLSNSNESEHKSLTTVGQVLDHTEVSHTVKLDFKVGYLRFLFFI